MKSYFFTNDKRTIFWSTCLAFVFSGVLSSAALGQSIPTIKTGCAGAISTSMAQIAAPYQRALTALNGSEVGWCAIASESSANTPREAAFWEFGSAAFVFHALRGRKELTPTQLTAVRGIFTRIPGIGNPPTRLKQIDTTLYVHMRTLAAQDSTDAMVLIDTIEQYSPAVYKTLMRRSARWGDADDN
jgi:hypothetical protein